MAARWDWFVILAGMRTGSNFLEANLDEYEGLSCHGELFNPHFVGNDGQIERFGITLPQREKDPMALIAKMRADAPGLAGFRLFQDHDPRVLAACLDDPRCAKVVLSRNPLDSYVSLKIAGATGQWRLGDMKDAKAAKATFVRDEFLAHLSAGRDFLRGIQRHLQVTGQTAFFLGYDDVGDTEVMNGLARFLGVAGARTGTSAATKKQNPGSLEDKVANPAEMRAALAATDPFGLDRCPVFEQSRGPVVPKYLAAAGAPLLFLPIPGGPIAEISAWLSGFDRDGRFLRGFTQKTLREWMRAHPGFRSFAVLRHPARRLHDAFWRHFLVRGPETFSEIRTILQTTYGMPLPDDAFAASYDVATHRTLFLGFLKFVAGNLSAQTSVRTDGAWATQLAILQGISSFAPPDAILREEDLSRDLPTLAAAVKADCPPFKPAEDTWPHPLAAIHDAEVEKAARRAHGRDYTSFGFSEWGP